MQLERDERRSLGDDFQRDGSVGFWQRQFHRRGKYDDERAIGDADDRRPDLRGDRTERILHVLGHAVSRPDTRWRRDRDLYGHNAGRMRVDIVGHRRMATFVLDSLTCLVYIVYIMSNLQTEPLSTRVPKKTKDIVTQMADREKRTTASMVRVLIEEALNRRITIKKTRPTIFDSL